MTTSIASYLISALTIIVTAISVGISQGLTNQAGFKAIDQQPHIKDKITNLSLLSSALIETAAVVSVFVAILLLFEDGKVINPFYSDLAKIGIGFAVICTGLVIGLVSAWPAQEACYSTARQPFHAQWIFNFTLIVLSILQTPLILAFIVALFINTQAFAANSLADSLRLMELVLPLALDLLALQSALLILHARQFKEWASIAMLQAEFSPLPSLAKQLLNHPLFFVWWSHYFYYSAQALLLIWVESQCLWQESQPAWECLARD